ncbi:class V lanthionine synthetase subunit LxmK [Kitasatospora sp. HPMI-4]|uniref:class V lanthionine synthetase subunit LxmK n=1 Tax=Kitasatospora sp. HPMI-4 TaxID=3448443 RepID=UPI003F1AC975
MDLDQVPAVDALLERLGLGPFDRGSLAAPVGRNDVWTGRTAGGRKVFVKRLNGTEEDVRARMRRLLSFELFAAGIDPLLLRRPAFLGSDESAGLVAFDCLEDIRSGAELMVDESFDDKLARQVGQLVGNLHGARVPDAGEMDRSLPQYPPVHLLHGLPSAAFDNCSYGELEVWRLLQADAPLIKGLERLRERESAAPKVPSHCDLRVDQLLVSGSDLYLTDWEEFRLADPARDVGAFAGEWLYRSVLDIVTTRGDSAFVDFELTHEAVLQRGVEKMNRLLPRVEHFWRGYRAARGDHDDELAVRATAFAGWHLLDRLIAGASRTARLTGIERAAAGIGRAALLTPEKFVDTLRFGEPA